ncbi:hypothetical protein ACS0TY_032818 [Phlomoides rotata]
MYQDNPAPLGQRGRDQPETSKGSKTGANHNGVRRWYNFGALASIRTIAPGFREISELPNWVLNAVVES